MLAENAELRAQLEARRDGGSLLSAIVGHLRAEGWSVLEPGISSKDEAAVTAGAAAPEQRALDTGAEEEYLERAHPSTSAGTCPLCKAPLPASGICSRYIDCPKTCELHKALAEPGATVRITDGRWTGRMANIVGSKLDDRFPARLLGKAVEVDGAVDCQTKFLLIDPKDPDEQKADSPPLNGPATPKRTDTAKPADQWHPTDDEVAKMAAELAMPVDQLRAHLATFKAEMMVKNIQQARWGLPFKGWVKKRAAQTTIPGA